MKKWAKEQNRHVFKEDIQIDKKYMERCSISLIIREIHIKTTMRYHLTPARMVVIKKTGDNKVLERVWRKGNPCALLVGR